jgi:ABC-type multidrug transport system permease subunit
MAAAHAMNLAAAAALARRAANELLRVPGAAIPGVLAPTIFFLGLTAVFGHLTLLPGFTTDAYQSFLIPVSMLQGAGFTGAATGVNLARDIERGWFDRLLAAPVPRPVLLAGIVSSASLRALIPATVLLAVGFSLGVSWPGIGGLVLALALVMAMALVAALWGTMLALRFRTQSAAPLMQAGMLVLILTTTAYAPLDLLTGWLHFAATYNPARFVVEAARQGFVGGVTWSGTWPGVAALAGMLMVLGTLAIRGLERFTDE